jgi:hypothetical protein
MRHFKAHRAFPLRWRPVFRAVVLGDADGPDFPEAPACGGPFLDGPPPPDPPAPPVPAEPGAAPLARLAACFADRLPGGDAAALSAAAALCRRFPALFSDLAMKEAFVRLLRLGDPRATAALLGCVRDLPEAEIGLLASAHVAAAIGAVLADPGGPAFCPALRAVGRYLHLRPIEAAAVFCRGSPAFAWPVAAAFPRLPFDAKVAAAAIVARILAQPANPYLAALNPREAPGRDGGARLCAVVVALLSLGDDGIALQTLFAINAVVAHAAACGVMEALALEFAQGGLQCAIAALTESEDLAVAQLACDLAPMALSW